MHTCHARGCNDPVGRNVLMCARHWRMVPFGLRKEVYNAYKPGQDIYHNPSPEWLHFAKEAIAAVREIEHLEPK